MPTITRDDIIKEVLFTLGVLRPGSNSTLSTSQIAIVAPILNTLITSWQSYFLESWPTETAVLFLSADKSHYSLDKATTLCALNPIPIYVKEVVSTTVIDVGNVDEFEVGQNIVLLSDLDRHTTTIADIPSDTELTLTTAMDSDFEPTKGFAYDESVSSIVRLVAARDVNTNADVTVAGKREYEEQVFPNINSDISTVVNLYRGTGKTIIKVWPPAYSEGSALKLDFQRPVETMANGTATADIPDEWKLALVLQCATMVHTAFGIELSGSQIPTNAANALAMARLSSSTNGSAFVSGNIPGEDC